MSALYMHTVFGQPGFWSPRDRQVYVVTRGHLVTLHPSLAEIRDQQRASTQTRRAMGFPDMSTDYGHVRVAPPNADPSPPARRGRS